MHVANSPAQSHAKSPVRSHNSHHHAFIFRNFFVSFSKTNLLHCLQFIYERLSYINFRREFIEAITCKESNKCLRSYATQLHIALTRHLENDKMNKINCSANDLNDDQSMNEVFFFNYFIFFFVITTSVLIEYMKCNFRRISSNCNNNTVQTQVLNDIYYRARFFFL